MAPAAPSSSSIFTGDQSGCSSPISAVHDDILREHILSRLHGLSLASVSCASSRLRSLAADNPPLWRHACSSTWPSTKHPRVQDIIASFPNFHRGFFSDSFPLLTGHLPNRRNWANPNLSSPSTEELISAVDICYRDETVFSRVQETETVSGWFEHSPFRVDLLDLKDSFRFRLRPFPNDGEFDRDLAENMKLSWIMIDPTRKRAANLSSGRPVSTERHWLTGEVSVKFSTVVAVDRQRVVEVEVKVVVTCGEKGGGEVHVREVGMRVENMEGKLLNGKDSLGILVKAMEFGDRKIDKDDRGRERHGEYMEMKRVCKEREENRERIMDKSCLAVGAFLIMGFWVVFLLKR